MTSKLPNKYDYRLLRQVINANHDRFSSLNFDSSMSLLQKVEAMVEYFKIVLKEFDDMVEYLDEFIANFDTNLYKTVTDVLNKFIADGVLTQLINDTLFKEVWAEITKLDQDKVSKNELDQLLNNLNIGIKGFYNTLGELQNAYPNGATGLYYVVADNYLYMWKNGTWTKVVEYIQTELGDNVVKFNNVLAKNKLYSLLPKDLIWWHTFKLATEIGNELQYNTTSATLEGDKDFYTNSVPSYGAYTKPIPFKPNEVLYLRGTSNYRVSMVMYNSQMIVIGATQWANEIDYTTLAGTTYVSFAVKRYDDNIMSLNEINNIDCGVYSEKLVINYEDFRDQTFYKGISKGSWEQGFYNIDQTTREVTGFTYSNFRNSIKFEVEPSSEYILNCNFNNVYRYLIILLDKNNKQLNNSGWVLTRTNQTIRTSPDTYNMIIMTSVKEDSSVFKDTQRIEMNLTLTNKNEYLTTISKNEFDKIKIDELQFYNSNEELWLPLSIAKGSDGKIAVATVTNRISTRIPLKKGIYLLKNNAQTNYRFTYIIAKNNGDYIQDTYWQFGGARLELLDDGFVYVLCYKSDSNGNSVDFTPAEKSNFNITIEKTTIDNPLLSSRFKKKVIMHRGASLIEPENTLPSFARVGKLGLWSAEMDVQLTKDDKLVIMHDDTIDRTTTGTGKVSELTLAQIKEVTIDFGANIDKYTDLKVPTLEEAINTCKKFGTIPCLDIGSFDKYLDKLTILADEMKKLGVTKELILLCQGTNLASRVRQLFPDTPIVAQYNGIIGDIEIMRLFRYPNAYCGGWNLTATDEQLKNLFDKGHAKGLQFYAITNDKSEASKWFSLGIDFLSSDDPTILDFPIE